MKIRKELGLSFVFISLFWMCIGQVDQVHIQKEWGEMDFAPRIAGYVDGDIPINKICDARGIYIDRGLKVISFKLELQSGRYDTIIRINGNQLPDSICAFIQSQGPGMHYYFTRICAMDRDGSLKHLSPLRLFTVREDD